MGKIVMTLLVRRQQSENAGCPYAVQICFPKELSPGEMTSLTSVRFIRRKGPGSSDTEFMDSYHPDEWRAADLSEQARYVLDHNGNPQPWYCVMRTLCKNVYDYPGSGDWYTNNGQAWPSMEILEREWKTEHAMHRKCKEEQDAEWNMRIEESDFRRSGRQISAPSFP
jgi:hypothetical protein